MPAEWIIASWNVNSVRVRMEHLLRFLLEWRPDVVCLQETKVGDEEFPLRPIEELGYRAEVMGQKSYNGVAILSPHPIEDVIRGFDGKGNEAQKRLIAATVRGVRVINGYFPNGNKVGSEKFNEKLAFFAGTLAYLKGRHQPGEKLVVVGDFNVAPEPGDVYDPEKMEGNICFHPEERQALNAVMEWGFHDQFRKFQQEPGHYTWWDYREGAYPRNAGLRIDHILATDSLGKLATACLIEKEERGRDKASDHVPIIAAYAGVD